MRARRCAAPWVAAANRPLLLPSGDGVAATDWHPEGNGDGVAVLAMPAPSEPQAPLHERVGDTVTSPSPFPTPSEQPAPPVLAQPAQFPMGTSQPGVGVHIPPPTPAAAWQPQPGPSIRDAVPAVNDWELAAQAPDLKALVLPHSLATQCRIVLTMPTSESFDLLLINARWRTALTLVLLSGMLAGMAYNLGRPGFGNVLAALAWGVIGGSVWALAGSAVVWQLLLRSARLLGGQGHPRILAYNLAVGFCPVAAVAVVVSLIPFLGPVLSALLLGYALVLAVSAVVAAQRLEVGRAMGAVLLSLGGMMLLALVAAVLVLLVVVFTLHGTLLG